MDETASPTQPLVPIDPSSLLRAWTGALENLPDAVFIVAGAASGGQILYVNSQAIRMFGYERGELINQSIDMLVPERLRQRHLQYRRVYAERPHLRHMGVGLP